MRIRHQLAIAVTSVAAAALLFGCEAPPSAGDFGPKNRPEQDATGTAAATANSSAIAAPSKQQVTKPAALASSSTPVAVATPNSSADSTIALDSADIVGTWKALGAGAAGAVTFNGDGSVIWINGQTGKWVILAKKQIHVLGAKGTYTLSGKTLTLVFPGAMPSRQFARIR